MQIGVEVSRMVDNRRIFIVHEDEILRAAMQFMLHDENEAHEVPNLNDAFARAAKVKVDLLLLDMAIVWSRGTKVLAEIKSRMPGVVVLLVAESKDDPDAHACLSAGADGIIGKPLTIGNVRHRVDISLGRIPVGQAWRQAS